MDNKDLQEYKIKLGNLSVNEQKMRDLYLRKLALGEIQGPPTGYASIDKPWLKYYDEEAIYDDISKMTLYQCLIENNRNNLDLIALQYYNNDISFGEMIDKINNFAISFSELGVKSGDHVILCMPNIPEFVYSFYALNKIGAIPNLIEPRTTASRINDYIMNANCKYMVMVDLCYDNINKIANDSNLERIITISPGESLKKSKKFFYNLVHKSRKTGGKYISYDDFYSLSEHKSDVKTSGYVKDRTAVVVYTSGTTGIPKGVELRNETYNGQNMQIKYSGIMPKKGEIFMGNVPFFSAYGSSSGMHNALSNGVTICLIPSPKLDKFAKYVLDTKSNHIMGSPRHFEILADYLKKHDNVDISNVKNFISGGDKLIESHEIEINKVYEKCGGPKVKKGLGSTEHGGGYTTTTNDSNNKIGCSGIPLAQNIIKIVDINTKDELTYNEIGEIYVASVTHANGYLNRDDLTSKAFYDENGLTWFKTGDLGYIDSDGSLFFVDRISRAIMRPDGHTVSLLPIENTISSLDFVKMCAAVGVQPDKLKTGEFPMVYVVLNDGVNFNYVKEDLIKSCDAIIERERPKWYRIVDEIPYTLMEKVDYVKLKKFAYNSNLNNFLQDERTTEDMSEKKVLRRKNKK